MSKSKYETHVLPYLEKIATWTEKGATQKEVAKKLGISYSCFKKYAGIQEDLKAALTRARVIPDDNVEASLYKRACGYQYEEVTIEEKLDRDGNKHTLKKVTVRDVAPDPTTIMFWLTNRRPETWSYHPENKKAEEELENNTGVVELPAILPEDTDDGE